KAHSAYLSLGAAFVFCGPHALMDGQRGVEWSWSEIVEEDEDGHGPPAPVVYRRKGGGGALKNNPPQPKLGIKIEGDAQKPIASTKTQRQSWICRALSSRGRKSIAFPVAHSQDEEIVNEGRQTKNKSQTRLPNKRVEGPPVHFVKEKKSYFQEVDSFELDEEDSSSPMSGINPTLEAPNNSVPVQNLVRGLDVVWEDSGSESFSRNSDKELSNCSDLLSLILQTPLTLSHSSASSDILISSDGFSFHRIKSSKQTPPPVSQSSTSSDILMSSDGFSFHKIKSSRQLSSTVFTENQDAAVECPIQEKLTPEPVNMQSTVQENRNKASLSYAGSISEAFDKMQIVDVHKSKNFEKCSKIEGEYKVEVDDAEVSTIEDPFSLSISDEDEPYELTAFDKLLKICGQTRPIRLFEAFSEF
ncbi:hypothetical protein KI387_016888, partial [Taxus chinensis]